MHQSMLKAVNNSNRRVMKKTVWGNECVKTPSPKHMKVNYCKEYCNWMAINAVSQFWSCTLNSNSEAHEHFSSPKAVTCAERSSFFTLCRERSRTEAVSLVLPFLTFLMNYCRLRAFKTTTDKQKPRHCSRSRKFSLSVRLTCGAAVALGTLRRAESCSQGRVPRPPWGGSAPMKAGMLPPTIAGLLQARGQGPGPRTSRQDNAWRDAQSPTGSPSADYASREAARQSAGCRVRHGASSQSRRGRGERRPPPMLFSLSRGAGVVGGGAILEGTSARSRAAPGRGPGRRHAVPGGLSGDDRAASHGSARQVHRDARDGPAGAEDKKPLELGVLPVPCWRAQEP
ncbi:uncharacterized protein LOC131573061 isoform X5 [Poecile atricapillus]|uniref:uncharacterized protein LOC131573061 isoform X5 n=1 Tax=Poecile atricapillus TaxID=48891 RepID=UPI00273A561E|nr:uncharacterized protein LOC131573061 isoform X5 [Poecile atricapillus]